MTAPAGKSPDAQEVKPFLEHLEDLRGTIIRCAAALLAGILAAVPLAPYLLAVLKRPLRIITDNPDTFLRSLEVGGAFSVSMKLAFWVGLLFSSPFLVLFIARFVFPGLTQGEKEAVSRASGLAVALFAAGVFLGYRFTLPATLRMMFQVHTWMGIRPEWTVTSYVSFAAQLLIGFGLVFELPVILLILGRIGLVNSVQLRTYRRHWIIAALVIGMVLTPPDVFSQLLMAVPLIVLYEICVWLVWAGERRRRATGWVASGPGVS